MSHARFYGAAVACVLLGAGAPYVQAAEPSAQPYIDRLKQGLEAVPPSESITELERKRLKPPANEGQYIDRLKQGIPPSEVTEPTAGYSERERVRLGSNPDSQGSAIQATLEGRSALRDLRGGTPKGATAFRIGLGLTNTISGSASNVSRSFETVYTTAPLQFQASYEFYAFRNAWLGSLGFGAQVGFSHARGTGRFDDATVTTNFGSESRLSLRFLTFPITPTVTYRVHALKWVKPFVALGFGVVPYTELRSDSNASLKGWSKHLEFTGGVAFMLDSLSQDMSFSAYEAMGIKHTYLTLEYAKRTTLASKVTFDYSGLFVGFAFEI